MGVARAASSSRRVPQRLQRGIMAWRTLVGAVRVVDIADPVAPSDHADPRDPAPLLVGLIDAPHDPVVELARVEPELAQPCFDLRSAFARDRHTEILRTAPDGVPR